MRETRVYPEPIYRITPQDPNRNWFRENSIAIYLVAIVVIGMIATVTLSHLHP